MPNRVLKIALTAQAALLLYGLVVLVVKTVTVLRPGPNQQVIGSSFPVGASIAVYVVLTAVVGLSAYSALTSGIFRSLRLGLALAETFVILTTAEGVGADFTDEAQFGLAVVVMVVLFVEARKARRAAPTS